jgi:hypothetical protein
MVHHMVGIPGQFLALLLVKQIHIVYLFRSGRILGGVFGRDYRLGIAVGRCCQLLLAFLLGG